MLVILLISLLQCSATAIPVTKEQEPVVIAIDDVEGILYEIPDYDDSHMMDYELSEMLGSPILSLLEMARTQSNNKGPNISQKEKISERQLILDDIIDRLQSVRDRLLKGNPAACLVDIAKSIQGLKKLERSLRPNTFPMLPLISRVMSLAQPFIQDEVIFSTMHLTSEPPHVAVQPSVSEAPVDEVQPSATVTPAVEVGSSTTEDQMYEAESISSEIPVLAAKPGAIETPVFADSGDVTKKSAKQVEVYKNKYKKGDDEKTAFQNKWAWRSGDFY